MVGRRASMTLPWLILCLSIHLSLLALAAEYFKPFNVSYDHRAMIVDGKRRMLISAGIHYPRATPEMWPDLIEKSKEGGADVIQTYVFWNGHEPVKGEYNFDGRYDLVKFVKLVGSSGLYLHLRIGPYVCAEWNFGGFPVWLRDIPGIEFRTDNAPFKDEMERFVKKIVDLMREEQLFSWQGGPIIMLQIENEYGNIEGKFGQGGKDYVKWAAKMALSLGARVPWVMCKQTDAPDEVVRSLAIVLNLSDLIYYGCLLSEPKWGHLKDLHAAIKLCEPSLVAADSPQYIKLGPKQEAHVYSENVLGEDLNFSLNQTKSRCSAFLANIDEHNSATVTFRGQKYNLPAWSVSILPDCKNTVFNSAKVAAQTSVKSVESSLSLSSDISLSQQFGTKNFSVYVTKSWMTVKEPIGIWSNDSFTVQGILEHLNVTKDYSDYLWYISRIYISDEDISFWEENNISPAVKIDSMRDVLRVFVNGKLEGTVSGRWVKVFQPVQFVKGYNDLVFLSQTVGLQNYGAFLEKDGAGFRGEVKLTGFRNGDIDLSKSLWTYQVGLKGEFLKIYAAEENDKAEWTDLSPDADPSIFTWYKSYFDAPAGTNPVALDLASMGKGQAWVNGHHIGRYWTIVAPKGGCQNVCDYRGAYNSDKCTTNCGKPTQTLYHIPRAWLKDSNNLLVLFEETGGNPLEISVKTRTTRYICGLVSESHYPPLHKWSTKNDLTPEMQLRCENGYTISSIEFASYGTPQGSCQKFALGKCHASNSLAIVSKACIGRKSCSVEISNLAFGGDPCRRVIKTLAVGAICSLSSSSNVGSPQLLSTM
uniref:Beta-galactosidase n=1 Tax=Cannabis sativa TaxID=3483 RepID=A0A803Q723_CANSA